jgi:hypothetical protein
MVVALRERYCYANFTSSGHVLFILSLFQVEEMEIGSPPPSGAHVGLLDPLPSPSGGSPGPSATLLNIPDTGKYLYFQRKMFNPGQ